MMSTGTLKHFPLFQGKRNSFRQLQWHVYNYDTAAIEVTDSVVVVKELERTFNKIAVCFGIC